MPDLVIPQTETLAEAEVAIRYRFRDPGVDLELSYMCGRCSGYGPPCRGCTDGRIHEKHTVASLTTRIGQLALSEIIRALTEAFQ